MRSVTNGRLLSGFAGIIASVLLLAVSHAEASLYVYRDPPKSIRIRTEDQSISSIIAYPILYCGRERLPYGDGLELYNLDAKIRNRHFRVRRHLLGPIRIQGRVLDNAIVGRLRWRTKHPPDFENCTTGSSFQNPWIRFRAVER